MIWIPLPRSDVPVVVLLCVAPHLGAFFFAAKRLGVESGVLRGGFLRRGRFGRGGGLGLLEVGPVFFGLVGVGAGEGEDSFVEAVGFADVGRDCDGISGAGVAAGEEFAAEVSVTDERVTGEGGEIERCLVVVELANEVVARDVLFVGDGGVAEEGVGGELHGTLAVHDAMTLMGVGIGVRGEPAGVGGGGLFFDLEEEWVVVGGASEGCAFEVDAEVAEADGAGANDLEGDVDGCVLREEVTALGLEGVGVGGEGGEDEVTLRAGDAGEEWGCGAEAKGGVRFRLLAGGFRDGLGEFFEVAAGCGAFGLLEDLGHGVDVGEAMDLVASELEDRHGGEVMHAMPVLMKEALDGFATRGTLDAGFATCEEDAGGEALEVVLEGAMDGLIEVIDVEDERSVRGGGGGGNRAGEGPEIGDVSVAADLGKDAGVGVAGEVGGHDGDGATEEAEGRDGHALVLDLEEGWDAALFSFAEEVGGGVGAGGG